MNIYRVSGRLLVCEICHNCGEYHDEHTYAVPFQKEIEAEDEKAAKALVLNRERRDYEKDLCEVSFEDAREVKMEFVREVSEAEQMRRIGAPQLFPAQSSI